MRTRLLSRKRARDFVVGGLSVLSVSSLAVGCGTQQATQHTGANNNQSISASTQPVVNVINQNGYPEPKFPPFKGSATITVWSWYENFGNVVKEFEKKYPNIHVEWKNVGAGQNEYTKLITALNTGSGAPDVAMIEYDQLPQFIQSGGLADITQYVSAYRPYFPAWVWNQTAYDGHQYGMPVDTGPMGLLYRSDLFAKYGLPVPKTWSEFAKEAVEFHKKDPNVYYSFFPYTDGFWIISLLWQAGVAPFEQTSSGWKIDFDQPGVLKVLNYWSNLVNEGAVQAGVDFSTSWNESFAKGKFATYVGCAWFPEVMIPDIKPGTQQWRAAQLPQWSVGAATSGDWGGSALVVTTQSKNKEAAALFAAFVATDKNAENTLILPMTDNGGNIFPGNLYATRLPALSVPIPFLGGQRANETVFAPANREIKPIIQWPPFTIYMNNEIGVEFQKVMERKESWQQALRDLDQNIAQYARSQGYQVVS
ncbi:MAG: sugar ABC transporter substrate-binding protein [Alicyclobacillus sp.]|nr:sugar ABC transporter substrate-binding protein [Alicyclobacillus sp.]